MKYRLRRERFPAGSCENPGVREIGVAVPGDRRSTREGAVGKARAIHDSWQSAFALAPGRAFPQSRIDPPSSRRTPFS